MAKRSNIHRAGCLGCGSGRRGAPASCRGGGGRRLPAWGLLLAAANTHGGGPAVRWREEDDEQPPQDSVRAGLPGRPGMARSIQPMLCLYFDCLGSLPSTCGVGLDAQAAWAADGFAALACCARVHAPASLPACPPTQPLSRLHVPPRRALRSLLLQLPLTPCPQR
jgi:hypothetical protein